MKNKTTKVTLLYNTMGAVADSKDMLNKISDTTKNGRFTPNTRKNLDEAIQIFMKDKKSSLNILSDMNSWDAPKLLI